MVLICTTIGVLVGFAIGAALGVEIAEIHYRRMANIKETIAKMKKLNSGIKAMGEK